MARSQKQLVEAGAPAPGFRLERLEGGEVTLESLIAGGPVLLVFFKVTCPVCQLALPFLNRIHRAGTLPVYAVSQNDPEDTVEFNREFGIDFPVLLDREDAGFPASESYGISSVPTMFLIESQGQIARVIQGWNRKEMVWLGTCANVDVIRPEDNVPEWKAG